ncbi:transposase [Streptomyces rimosus]|uniref:Tn3 family transposase n=1 Tax=Streptomyces rimosus TaxID=1927 RepID=UPI0018FEE396|nr:Tn3 family transposase [Streptomyces rimosus]
MDPFEFFGIGLGDPGPSGFVELAAGDPAAFDPAVERDAGDVGVPGEVGQPPFVRAELGFGEAPAVVAGAAADLSQEFADTGRAELLDPFGREETFGVEDGCDGRGRLLGVGQFPGPGGQLREVAELIQPGGRAGDLAAEENILFKLAEASIGEPEGTVREVVYPAVSGGEQTLRELVHEFKTRGPVYRRTVQTTLKASYTNHYRRGLIRLLDVLEFRSSNHTHQPVIEALALVARYAAAGNTTYYPLGETVPAHKAMGGDWAEVVHRTVEDELHYVRRRYLSAEAARAIAVNIANATFAARSAELWGQGSTAVASDSTHVRAYDQNLFTEWHSRYGGRGVLIYWHVEKKSLAIHSQLINCTASEVAAMIEGAMRHGTTMDVEANYTDSHGQSEIGFGITRLLNFDLLPRIKRINRVKLYRPVAGEPDAYPQLTPALTRSIRWELIAQQYDQMIKYATAIRTRTASTEAILRRFTRNASHPTYAAMLEVGRAQKTIFVARYLRLRDLQREIEEGLNVMESSNGANSVIAYGKGGEIASNRRDEQEMFVLCLRILQSALVYVNTLMLQDVLGEPEWAGLLTPADRRGLTPLFWSHVRPYGEVNLDMDARLNLAAATVPGPRASLDGQPAPPRDQERAEPSQMQAKQ